MTQHDSILKFILENGSITMVEGFSDLGITKINSRCGELKKMGYPIIGTWETSPAGKRFMRYSLPQNYQMKLF